MLVCRTCGKNFHPYLGRRIYCSEECYLEQKHLDNITNWKKKRSSRIKTGKTCKRCKELFYPGANGSRYCNTCKEVLMEKPKKKERLCKICSEVIVNLGPRANFCIECRALRTVAMAKKARAKARATDVSISANNRKRGKAKSVNPKWLVRGSISGGSRACAITQDV